MIETSKLSLIVVALLGLLVGTVIAATIIQYYYPNIGIIAQGDIAVYLDGTQLANDTAIDWGTCTPGETYYFQNLTVANIGNMPLTITITTYNLPSDWQVIWQGNNTTIDPTEQVGGWLNLTIPTTATTWGNWGFYITGT